jgi:phosphonate transport system ATP-binding protein
MARTNKLPVLIAIHDVNLAQRYVERIVALKAGVKIYDGPANALDFESVYKLIEPRPEATSAPAANLTMEPAR